MGGRGPHLFFKTNTNTRLDLKIQPIPGVEIRVLLFTDADLILFHFLFITDMSHRSLRLRSNKLKILEDNLKNKEKLKKDETQNKGQPKK